MTNNIIRVNSNIRISKSIDALYSEFIGEEGVVLSVTKHAGDLFSSFKVKLNNGDVLPELFESDLEIVSAS